MASSSASVRNVRIFRYDPQKGGEGHFDHYTLEISDETTTTILDVLLRIQREQDPTLAFRYACRVNMCGSCGMVINGRERLACKTNVSHVPRGQDIALRPLNHFPVIKDLVVDMDPFFRKYEEALLFYEPKEEFAEPASIRPDSRERRNIGLNTECIACGCCVSSCTMCRYHEGYAGPAALNRAFTLLADSRDGLFEPRLTRAMASCYNCRTEFNCTEVCPKEISPTRAIKHIQWLAVTHRREQPRLAAATGSQESAATPASQAGKTDRRTFLRQVCVGVCGVGSALALGGVASIAAVGPALRKTPRRWVAIAKLADLPSGLATVMMNYEVKSGIYMQSVSTPVLVSRAGGEIVCFKSSCPHLGCLVRWDGASERFRCACHGGTFDRDGKVLSGPPPRPLDRYVTKVESDQLFVEVG
ncbi:MAG: 2Fe-2S iron-sulfur cluster-binding protein [Candidatus Sumerlaeota bacterium]|nr:2Fe-2S iron-sulfur cluster-binding protein [Candidatus Sumerlaeota bacterium]